MDFPTQKLLIFNSKLVTFILALDLVDNDLLAGIEPIDLSILGELRLNKIDYICEDITDLTGGFVWSIGKGLLGDLALDLVDNDLLAGIEPIDLSILGELRLNKIDYICEDITDLTGGFVWAIGKGLLVQIHPVNHQFTKKSVGFLFTFSLAFLYYCMYNFHINIFLDLLGIFE